MLCAKLLLLTLFQAARAQAAQDISCKKAKDGALAVWRRRQLGSVKSSLAILSEQLTCFVYSGFNLYFIYCSTLRARGRLYQVRGKQEKQTHSFFASFQMQGAAEEWRFCIYFALFGMWGGRLQCVHWHFLCKSARKESKKSEFNSDCLQHAPFPISWVCAWAWLSGAGSEWANATSFKPTRVLHLSSLNSWFFALTFLP